MTNNNLPKSIDEQLDEILKRLLADVDDHMDFVGIVWQSKANASTQISDDLVKAKAQFIALIEEVIGEDELKIGGADRANASNSSDKRVKALLIRDKLRQAQRNRLYTEGEDK